jgi:hypothetical protein
MQPQATSVKRFGKLMKIRLQVSTYRAKNQQKVDIPFIQVIYADSIAKVTEVAAVFRADTPLYYPATDAIIP